MRPNGLISIALVNVLGGIIGIAGTATGIHFVRNGEMALVIRLGKVRRKRTGPWFLRTRHGFRWNKAKDRCQGPYLLKGPGPSLGLPCVDKYVRLDVREQVTEIPPVEVVLQNGLHVKISAVVCWQRFRSARALFASKFKVENLELALQKEAGATGLQVLSELQFLQLVDDDTPEKLRADLQDRVRRWGAKVNGFRLKDIAPSDETARVIQIPAVKAALDEALGQKWSPDRAAVLARTSLMVAVSSDGSLYSPNGKDAVPHEELPISG